MPQRAKGTVVTEDELDKIEGRTPDIPGQKTVEPPGFFSRLGETVVSPIMALGQGIESISKPGAMGVNAALAGIQNLAEHQDPTRAILAGSPVGSISEDVYDRNVPGLLGTALGTAALSGLSPEVRSVGRDITVGTGKGVKGSFAQFEHPVKMMAKDPVKAITALPGYYLGHKVGGYPGGLAGAALGSTIPEGIRGAVSEVKSGWRARHPWEGPDIAPGETRTPYRAPREVREGYRNPPSTGSQVSGPTYQVPKEEPSPLERITGETRTPYRPPRPDRSGYRNPPSKVQAKPPEPALVPSKAMSHLLSAIQEMIKRQQPKD